ncbi:MAG TPA: hypothetical protein DC023_03415, partial [Oceanospirillaceae bacterium]|nr:hypothetical protein [Oceanospirillaceae bacterium]
LTGGMITTDRIEMAGGPGFQPAPPAGPGRYSNQLNYRSAELKAKSCLTSHSSAAHFNDFHSHVKRINKKNLFFFNFLEID